MKHLLFLLCVFGVTFTSCSDDRLREKTIPIRNLFNTEGKIIIKYRGHPNYKKYIKKAVSFLEKIDSQMNAYDEMSLVYELNKNGKVKATPDLLYVVQQALKFHTLSDGRFDITCMPLIRYYRHCAEENLYIRDNDINRLRRLVGSDNIIIDNNHIAFRNQREYRIRGEKYATMIDLGALAKGYAADKALTILKQPGIVKALIEIGGEVTTFSKNDDSGWTIGLKDFTRPEVGGATLEALEITNYSLATSGSYHRQFTIQGQRYSHIIDPRTGRPVESDIASVTVIAERCMYADAIATFLYQMGTAKAIRFVNQRLNNATVFAVVYTTDKKRFTSKGVEEKFMFTRQKNKSTL